MWRGTSDTFRHSTVKLPRVAEQRSPDAVAYVDDDSETSNAVNIAAPHPLPNAEFMQVLREACGVPLGLPAKKWMLEIGAVFMRTETELILKSRRVVPARLVEHGFRFKYPDWRDAALDLCRQSLVARDQACAA
jgi:NAD dependent epimerase/dehydratase family enzyme